MNRLEYDTDSTNSDSKPAVITMGPNYTGQVDAVHILPAQSSTKGGLLAQSQRKHNLDSQSQRSQTDHGSNDAKRFKSDDAETDDAVDQFLLELQQTMQVSPVERPDEPLKKTSLYQMLLDKSYISDTTTLPVITTECSKDIKERIEQWLNLKSHGQHFNDSLKQNHTFKNPQIMNKLVEYMRLDPYSSKLAQFDHGLVATEFDFEGNQIRPKGDKKKERSVKDNLYTHFTKQKGKQQDTRRRRI